MWNSKNNMGSKKKKVDRKEVVSRTRPHGPGYPVAKKDLEEDPK